MTLPTDTESPRRNTMDINCLSTGNTLLIKIDSIKVIQNQFDTFLENFMKNENIFHDLKLPLFVTRSFSKLFKRWLEYPELQKLISRDVFEEIFKDMAIVFEPKEHEESSNRKSPDGRSDSRSNEENSPSNLKLDSPPNRKLSSPSSLKSESQSKDSRNNAPAHLSFKIFCNDCNENIEIVNDDPYLSYNQHVKSEEHLKYFDPPPKIESLIVDPLNKADNEEPASSNASDIQNTNNESGILKFTSSSNSNNADNLETVNEYKLPTLYEPFCQPCCKNIKAQELFIGKHLRSKKHKKHVKLYEDCRKILEENGSYFSITNEDTFEFCCHICMKKQKGTSSFIRHCKGIEHLNNLEQFVSLKL